MENPGSSREMGLISVDNPVDNVDCLHGRPPQPGVGMGGGRKGALNFRRPFILTAGFGIIDSFILRGWGVPGRYPSASRKRVEVRRGKGQGNHPGAARSKGGGAR